MNSHSLEMVNYPLLVLKPLNLLKVKLLLLDQPFSTLVKLLLVILFLMLPAQLLVQFGFKYGHLIWILKKLL